MKRVISIVAPVYREERILPLFIEQIGRLIDDSSQYDWEVIFVDDGSDDQTLGIIKGLRAADSRIKWISFTRNFGHQAALTAGIERARGDAVIMMDADLEHPVSVLPQLIQRWSEGYDLVIAVRKDATSQRMSKRFFSAAYYRLLDIMAGMPIQHAAPDFRLMSRRAVQAFLRFGEVHRFIRGMIAWMGFRVSEVHFDVGKRVGGASKYSLKRMIRLALDGITSFSITPLRLIAVLGLFICMMTLMYACYVIIVWTYYRQIVLAGWTSLILSVNFLGGMILLSLGIIGEYIGRIYEQVKARPLYLVSEEDGFGE